MGKAKDRVLIKNTRAAEHAIRSGFTWAHTPQGVSYWAEVVDNLKALRGEENEQD